MAFYLHSAEIDKARAVAERALKTISFRFVCQFIAAGFFEVEIEVVDYVPAGSYREPHL